MNAVASTLVSDQPARVLTSQLSDVLALVNAATRQLREKRWRVVDQRLNVGTGNRPLLFIEPAPGALALHATQLISREEKGKRHYIGRFGNVDIAQPAPVRAS